jgi:hypothetical protein
MCFAYMKHQGMHVPPRRALERHTPITAERLCLQEILGPPASGIPSVFQIQSTLGWRVAKTK